MQNEYRRNTNQGRSGRQMPPRGDLRQTGYPPRSPRDQRGVPDPRASGAYRPTTGQRRQYPGGNGMRGQAGPYNVPPRRRPTEEELRRQAARRAEYERRRRAAAEMRRRVEEQIKREKKMRRKRQRKMLAARSVICLMVFSVLAVLLTGVLAAVFFSSPDGEPGSVKYYFGGKEIRTASSDTAYQNGKMYICFNDLAESLGLSVSGDAHGMKFVFPESEPSLETGSEGSGREDHVTFLIDSRTVEINGETVMLSAETFLYGENVWVSTEFIAEYIDGLKVKLERDSIFIDRIEDPEVSTQKGEDPVYLQVALKLKDHGAVSSPTDKENGTSGNEPSAPDFTVDLSEYEKYMAPEDGDEYLILVNYANTVDATLSPEDLASVINTRQDGRETQYLRLYAAKALEALYLEMYAAGYTDVSVMSGYRSYEYQANLHEEYIKQEMIADGSLTYEAARQIVLTYSAAPGTSEHQTGLCVDMHNLPSATTEFATQGAYTWLCENAWKFGFILRYPENKTDVTQISFEPWHWRYVGRAHAKAMYDSGMCLEEYVSSMGN